MRPYSITRANEMQIIDFRTHKKMWGHNIHGSTFSMVKADNFLRRIIDWWRGTLRYNFLCHYHDRPMMGDQVMWTAKDHEVCGTIYKVKGMGDPNDMWELWVSVEKEGRKEILSTTK